MRSKFPNLWEERNGANCYDQNGNLTSKAQTWAHELALLTPEMVKTGLRDLSHLPNPAWPPSAIEFVKHCRDRFYFAVQDEVMAYINRPDKNGWEWSGMVAWNVYANLHYNPHGAETHEQLRNRIEKVYRGLSWHDLKPVPDYTAKALPRRDYHPINDQPGYRQFCARVAHLITANTDCLQKWNKQLSMIFPGLVREWWPDFKTSNMKVGDWLRDVQGLNLPNEPESDDVIGSIINKALA
jgi:hypothetical protein